MTDLTACFAFDFDAVSVWLHGDGAPSPTELSRGEYGADVAVPRLLDVLDRTGVTATFFTPGHTVDSFPERVRAIHDRGHDIQHHGWSHRSPGTYDSRAAERADLVRGIESVRSVTGERPSGYRSPAWDFSPHTLSLLRELDFAWDSSQMGHDFEPYYLRTRPDGPADQAYVRGEPTDVLEFPVAWNRDDWPPFQYVPGTDGAGAAPDERRTFAAWEEQFDWACDNVEGGVFSLTFHPQVVGRPPRLRYLESLLRTVRERPGVDVATFDEVAAGYREGLS